MENNSKIKDLKGTRFGTLIPGQRIRSGVVSDEYTCSELGDNDNIFTLKRLNTKLYLLGFNDNFGIVLNIHIIGDYIATDDYFLRLGDDGVIRVYYALLKLINGKEVFIKDFEVWRSSITAPTNYNDLELKVKTDNTISLTGLTPEGTRSEYWNINLPNSGVLSRDPSNPQPPTFPSGYQEL